MRKTYELVLSAWAVCCAQAYLFSSADRHYHSWMLVLQTLAHISPTVSIRRTFSGSLHALLQGTLFGLSIALPVVAETLCPECTTRGNRTLARCTAPLFALLIQYTSATARQWIYSLAAVPLITVAVGPDMQIFSLSFVALLTATACGVLLGLAQKHSPYKIMWNETALVALCFVVTTFDFPRLAMSVQEAIFGLVYFAVSIECRLLIGALFEHLDYNPLSVNGFLCFRRASTVLLEKAFSGAPASEMSAAAAVVLLMYLLALDKSRNARKPFNQPYWSAECRQRRTRHRSRRR